MSRFHYKLHNYGKPLLFKLHTNTKSKPTLQITNYELPITGIGLSLTITRGIRKVFGKK